MLGTIRALRAENARLRELLKAARPYVKLCITSRDTMRPKLQARIEAILSLMDGPRKRCVECGKYWADPPSDLCPGCKAYQEHLR